MKLETLEQDRFYHIFNRGINGENIFTSNENRNYFLKLFDKHLKRKIDVYSYCLLNNHFHFVIEVKEKPAIVTQALSNFFNAYAKAFNRAQSRTGSLFEKHFKRIQLKDEDHLKRLIIYVHLNPQIHFGKDFERYVYSSFPALVSEKKTLLMRDDVIELFEDKCNFEYVHKNRSLELEEKYKLE